MMQVTPTKVSTAADRSVPPYPTSVRIAAIIWIALGAYLAVVFAAIIVGVVVPMGVGPATSNAGGEAPASSKTTLTLLEGCVMLAGVIVAAAMLAAGIKTLRAKALDTRGWSVFSLVIGTLIVFHLPDLPDDAARAVLLLAGGLGLAGRKAYLAHRGAVRSEWLIAEEIVETSTGLHRPKTGAARA